MYLAFGIDTGHSNCRQLATHCTGVDVECVGLSRAGKETRQALRNIPRSSALIVLPQVWITSMTRASVSFRELLAKADAHQGRVNPARQSLHV
jgi:hypothetical protein